MRKLRFIPLILIIAVLFCFAAPAASAVEPPHLKSADAVLLIDMYSGTPLYELNADQPHSIASLTKIMTCLLAVEAVENGKVALTDMVEAQSDCLQGLDVSSSNAGIQPGEVMSFKDLIYCALVHSANDACNVIATHVGGSIASFVQMMNARAKEIGCANTQFIDTDGMLNRSEGHYSTPYDLYLITKEAFKHPLFAQVCSTADYTVAATNLRESFDIHNSNALLSENGLYGDGYLYNGVVGVKTGFTKPAGYCLVSACSRGESFLMCIVMGCNGPLTYTFAGEYQNFQDSATLYDWAFGYFASRTIFLAGEPMKRMSVENAKDEGTVALCPTKPLTLFLPNDVTDDDIVIDIQPYTDKLVAPITKGDIIGKADVYISGEYRTTVEMAADESVELSKSLQRKQNMHEFFTSKGFRTVIITVISLVVLLIAFRLFLRYRRRQQLRAKIEARNRRMYEQQRTSGAQPRPPIPQQAARPHAQRSESVQPVPSKSYNEYEEYRRRRQTMQQSAHPPMNAGGQRVPIQQQSTEVPYSKQPSQRSSAPQPIQNVEKKKAPTPIQRVDVNADDFDIDAYIDSLK